ncbi:MAG: hypothetical protein LBU18_01670, partial [Treponema sp.]|nr:hypothetical protein [Treponema sp.]
MDNPPGPRGLPHQDWCTGTVQRGGTPRRFAGQPQSTTPGGSDLEGPALFPTPEEPAPEVRPWGAVRGIVRGTSPGEQAQ